MRVRGGCCTTEPDYAIAIHFDVDVFVTEDAISMTFEGEPVAAAGFIGSGKLISSWVANGSAFYPIGGISVGWAMADGCDIVDYLLCDSVDAAGTAF